MACHGTCSMLRVRTIERAGLTFANLQPPWRHGILDGKSDSKMASGLVTQDYWSMYTGKYIDSRKTYLPKETKILPKNFSFLKSRSQGSGRSPILSFTLATQRLRSSRAKLATSEAALQVARAAACYLGGDGHTLGVVVRTAARMANGGRDAPSIITQVSRDPDHTSVNASNGDPTIIPVGAAPQTKRRGLLSSLLCCVSRSPPTAPNHPQQSNYPSGPSNPQQSASVRPSGSPALLGEHRPQDRHRKCLVIDLDETLVHSSFTPVANADFVVPVEIEGIIHQVYVLKRPHVDQFLKRMGELFECVLFTASLAKYADPVTDLLDRTECFSARLFRESCVFHRGNYVKDLSKLGRDINNTIIIDNSPPSYIFHPDNAVPCGSWFDDPKDTELLDLIPFFEGLSQVDNAVEVLRRQA